MLERLPDGLWEQQPRTADRKGGRVRSIAIQVVHKGDFVGITKCITLKALSERIESSSEHHGTIADLVLFARQTKSVDLDSILAQAFVIQGIAIFRQVDMFKGADDKADMLWEDGSITGEARGLSRRVSRIENLFKLVFHTQRTSIGTHIVGQSAGANNLHFHGLFLL